MKAYRQVVSNKGSAGVDGMSVKELYAYLTKNRERIETEIRQGKYLPQAILGVVSKRSEIMSTDKKQLNPRINTQKQWKNPTTRSAYSNGQNASTSSRTSHSHKV